MRRHVVEQGPPRLAAHARRVREVRHEVARVPEPDALEPAGQEPAAPVVVEEQLAAGLALVARGHHDERRQVVGLAAEPVRQPGPHAGPARDLRARHEERHAGRVVDGLGVHASNQADLVGDRSHVREHLAHLDAGLAVLLERLDRGEGRPLAVAARHGREPGRPAHAVGDVLPGRRPHHRLGVEQVHMRRPAPLPEDDDPLRLRGEMGQARQPGLALRPVGARAAGPFPMSDARAAIPTPLAAEPNN